MCNTYAKRKIDGKSYDFPLNWNIPEGRYHAILDKIEDGKSIKDDIYFEACYTINRDSTDKTYRLRHRLGGGSCCLNDLLDAAINAGVDIRELTLYDISNVELYLDIEYDLSGFGSGTLLHLYPSKD